ncbi:MAG: 50S ribosomal protein L18 [Planctomycetes bacterium]|nr:50S ribosomal protein L18 [Planctomycetota bacterium]
MGHARTFELRKWNRRAKRAGHVRRVVSGTSKRPRLSIYRSHRHFHAQLIDDTVGRTVASASSLQKDVRGTLKQGGDRTAAQAVGRKLAEAAKAAGVTQVVFDRNFYRFHGRVRAFAEAAAKGGLDFLVNPKKKDRPPKEAKAAGAKPAKKDKPAKPPKAGAPAESRSAPAGVKGEAPKGTA